MSDANDSYILITCDEDGGVWVKQLTKAELHLRLQETDEPLRFLTDAEWPKEKDPQYWGGKALLLKGRAVTPVPKEVVMKFEVP